MGNNFWELFMEKFQGKMPKHFWEQQVNGVAPNCGKQEFPKIPGNKIY